MKQLPCLVKPIPAALAWAREREVLAHLALGMSNSDVALYLNIKERTVKTHLARLMLKLEIREKAQAIAAAYRTGLVQPPSRPALHSLSHSTPPSMVGGL